MHTSTFPPTDSAMLPAAYVQPHWYAIYTSANHEKRIAEQLALRSLECFLPLYESVRRWKDRRVVLNLPLFAGYVFVRMPLRDKLKVVQIPGVAHLVGFAGTPVALPDAEIETLLASLKGGVAPQPHPFLTVGRRVRVKAGPLAGLIGTLIEKKNRFRLVISIELIQRSLAVQIDAQDVEPLKGSLTEATRSLGGD
jgi:transcription antitermination factor NusG